MFKTHVKQFVSLRKARPLIALENLQAIARHFPHSAFRYHLDPSFEPVRSPDEAANPTIPPPNPTNAAIFKVLQSYNRVGLVRPVDTEHMWNAAMERKTCELTILGKHYRDLVARGLI